MSKLLIVSKDKKIYKTKIYINDCFLYEIKSLEKICFEIKEGIYNISCISDSSFRKSNPKSLNLNSDVKIEVSQGFLSPNVEIVNLPIEEADVAHPIKFDAGIFNNNTISDYEPTYTNKKRHPALTIVCWILAAFFLYYAIKLSIQEKRNVQFQYSNTPKYSDTIEKMGKNEEGFYCLTGTVTSNTNKTADGLKIEFKCYDSSGNYIVSLYDYIENLDSGETWSYDIKDIFNSDKISSCNYYQIVPYTKIVEFH